MKHLATLMLCLAAASAAQAQTVYRCGSSYADAPCPQAALVDAADPRSAAQRADAQRVAADEKRMADRMERERLALAATQKPAGAGSLSGTPAKPVERARTKKGKWIKLAKPKPATKTNAG